MSNKLVFYLIYLSIKVQASYIKAKPELDIFSPRVLTKRAAVTHIHAVENRQFCQFKTGNFPIFHSGLTAEINNSAWKQKPLSSLLKELFISKRKGWWDNSKET